MLLDLVELFLPNSVFNISLDLRKGLVQAFKQGLFFIDCQHDRAPLGAQHEMAVLMLANIEGSYRFANPSSSVFTGSYYAPNSIYTQILSGC